MSDEQKAGRILEGDDDLRQALKDYRTIAVVGISAKTDRDSYRVAEMLQKNGYTIIPVNPRYEEVLGEKCYPSLLDIPGRVDLVDVFRRGQAPARPQNPRAGLLAR